MMGIITTTRGAICLMAAVMVISCSPSSGAQVRHNCPKKCPANEVLLWCPPVCEPTCDIDCVPTPSGDPIETCVCKPGYVRHQGQCIRRCDCPPKPTTPAPFCAPCSALAPGGSGERQHYVPPVSNYYPGHRQHYAPKPELESSGVPESYSITSQSQNLSSHSNYLYRRPGPNKPCPPFRGPTTTVSPFDFCPPNEVSTPSPICCEPTCTKSCAAVQCRTDPPTGPHVCTCASGFVRYGKKCIRPEECPVEEKPKFCGPNAYYSPCTPCCQPTCTEDCSRIRCIAACSGPPTCVCNPGYVLHEGNCIRPSECPGKCPTTTTPRPTPTTESPVDEPSPCCPPGATLRPFRPCCVDSCTTDCRTVRCFEQFKGPPTCVCEYGLVMHNNCCIPRELCPKPCPLTTTTPPPSPPCDGDGGRRGAGGYQRFYGISRQ
ncbi:keratin-associated protein 9-1-like [Anopheles darlingi]|uniref:keratin-associated protein 9-1-like n=1 Tax=Anopheles darlingi TaxID=43151 RepID=UPI002100582A|nr:keratin-associated protein 9-1-like [Anopheles darlingi]